jgi:hypothetical protein
LVQPIATFALLLLTGFQTLFERPTSLDQLTQEITWSTGRIEVQALPVPCAGVCTGERRMVSPIGTYGAVEPIAYDYTEVTRSIELSQMAHESDVSIAVRLLLGEVGPSRLVNNENGFEEAVGILDSVKNRMDPAAYNPEGKARFRGFPGCGPEGSLQACVNPRQYLGIQSVRALRPTHRIRPEILEAAVDRAVLAWWLVETGTARGVSNGATSFVHRCGGTAYGLTTDYCDGRGKDMAGAQGTTGPLVLKGPGEFLPSRGHYALVERAKVDYVVD